MFCIFYDELAKQVICLLSPVWFSFGGKEE